MLYLIFGRFSVIVLVYWSGVLCLVSWVWVGVRGQRLELNRRKE